MSLFWEVIPLAPKISCRVGQRTTDHSYRNPMKIVTIVGRVDTRSELLNLIMSALIP